ncbi:MAG: heavy-metal-associated domain-containing protein [Neisseriaceae bacterium]|nr:heavy-metal-associated domain-containing protein [Neisseriaceae bacterium]
MAQLVLDIGGMTCCGCVKNVQKVLDNHAGVLKADVDLSSGVATVDFDDKQTQEKSIIEAIESIGFDACKR